MRKTLVAAAAAIAVASGAMIGQAAAADLEYMPAPAPPPFVPTWSGFYIGGHVGYGEANFDVDMSGELWDLNDTPADVTDDISLGSDSFGVGLSADGLIGGVQGGYNWQAGSLVFGIEGDVSFTDWDQRSTVFDTDDGDLPDLDVPAGEYIYGTASAEIDMLASVRGRLGYAMDSFMIYGTGGIAWADATARAEVVVSDFGDPLVGAGNETVLSDDKDFSDIGFVLGGGMAFMVVPQTFSVGLEGLYYFFDQDETLFDGTFARNIDQVAGDDVELEARATASLDDAWVIRARADFHF